MRYLNATRTSFGEDRRVYKAGVGGVTSTQEVFDVNYDNGRVDVFLNGVRLVPDDDYTRTVSGIGTSIDLVSDIGANNVLEVVGYQGINSGNALVEDNFVVGTNSTGSGGAYSGSTTVFPVSNSAGDTVSVWRNGIKLVPTTDYTVQASANTVTLPTNQAASANDEITVQVVGALAHADFIRGADLQDDDAFGSASATKVASSESIKAYADTKLATSTASSTYQTITNSDRLAHQGEPHIIPGVLYPAVAGKLLDGSTSHGTGTYGGSAVSTDYGTTQSDGRKYYYTDIKGSKPIKDPRIGGHFGSQRHKFKSLQLLEQETATHGNDVFSIDGREWCRLVNTGSVKFVVENGDAGNGLNVTSHTFTAFFEITGYFNDFNCISWTKSDRADDINITVNGGTTRNSANTDLLAGKATVQTPLNGRYVDAGSVINHGDSNVASDLGTTPSINTIKIEAINTGSEYWRFYGIELIAQDTTSTANRSKIQIPSQNVVSYGKKFTVSAEGSSGHHYNPFNGYTATSSFSSVVDVDTSLGLEAWKHTDNNYYPPVNGGRIVKWVDSSGVIKTSVTLMPPNATGIGSFSSNPRDPNYGSWSSQYQPTFKNETERQLHEVAKTFHYREFGNGSANGNASSYQDASTLNTTANGAYVMDDGLTSISFYQGVGGGLGGFDIGADFDLYVTFIGTGFSYTRKTSSTTSEVHHIAQNLPYGTHIIEWDRASSGNDMPLKVDGVTLMTGTSAYNIFHQLSEVHFFQPKRPPIPEDACVIADYMLMADFVPQTAGTLGHISKGIRSVSGSRDVFVDRVGSVAFSLVMDVAAGPMALRVGTSALGVGDTATIKLPYFGTDFLIQHYNNRKGTITENLNSDVGTYANISTSAYEGLSKHTGNNLGLNELKNHITDGQNDDELWTSHVQIATPIHTSSHYQTFETPFLHELVGGDRNMEQTNLVCSPDGKTWDEVTRDTLYIGNSVLTAKLSVDVTNEATLIFDDFRGVVAGQNQGNKDFAIAYDRFICLRDGGYNFNFSFASTTNGQWCYVRFYLNGVEVFRGMDDNESQGRGNISASINLQLKRGDYVNFPNSYQIEGGDQQRHNFSVTRI